MTLEDIYTAWVPEKKRQVKQGTFSAYNLAYVNHLKPSFGNKEVSGIDKFAVRAWVYEKIDSGLSIKSVQDLTIVLKMLLKYGEEEMGLIIPSVNWKISWPTKNKVQKEQMSRFSKEEVKLILDYCDQNPSPQNLGIALCLKTGMRIGEICALRWEDVDFERKVLTVNRTVERVYNIGENGKRKTEVVFSTPKTSSSARVIPLEKKLCVLMKKYAAVANKDYYIITNSSSLSEPRTYRAHYKRLLDKLGLKGRKFHGLRHTFASIMIESGADLKTVSSILGHSSVSITMDIYVHPSEEAKSQSINKFMGKF